MLKVAINGLGRIGRLCFKNLLKTNWADVVFINTSGDIDLLLNLLRYDSTHGVDNDFLNDNIKIDNHAILIKDKRILYESVKDLSDLTFGSLGVDIVFDCTGKFLDRSALQPHINNGAKKVLISAPSKSEMPNIVYGVNHKILKKEDTFISASSCTTNCLAPLVKILNDEFEIIDGFMTTVHAYTSDQNLLDGTHKDFRRARSACRSIVPTSTGAAKSIGLILPELNGKLQGSALRVPVENGSLVDLTVNVKKLTTKNEVNKLFKKKSLNDYAGILRYTEDPIVSVDIIGDPSSAILDAGLTDVNNKTIKLMAWYDNEIAYAKRMCDIAKYLYETNKI